MTNPTPMTREPRPHMHDCEHGFDRTLCYCDTPEACLCDTEDDNVEAAPAPTVEPSHLQEAGAASTPMTREPEDDDGLDYDEPLARRILTDEDLAFIDDNLLPYNFADWYEVQTAMLATINELRHRAQQAEAELEAIDKVINGTVDGDWECENGCFRKGRAKMVNTSCPTHAVKEGE